MADYKEYLSGINRELYHEGEWQWQEGEYTVTRSHQYTAPGCHNSCGVLLYTKDGKLEKVEGDPLNPFNNGKLCMRCLNLVEAVDHPDRLKYPMKRVGQRGENKWQRISWDEAYEIICEKVNYYKKNFGPESIVGVHGTGRNINWQLPMLFNAGIQTPNISTLFFSGFACYLPRIVGSTAVNGDFMIVDASVQHPDRYANAEWQAPECVIVWGNDPLKSNADGFLGHWLVQCMQMGTKIISVDPRLTWWSARAEVWLPIRPGTDAALAIGLLNVIIEEDLYVHDFVENWTYGFEELAARVKEYPVAKVAEITGLPAEKIQKAARLFAQAKPAAIQWGLAFEQQISCMSLVLAVADLIGITGNIDVPGGMLLVRHAFNAHRHYNCGSEFTPPEVAAKKLNGAAKGVAENSIVPHADSDVILRAMETGKPYPLKMLWVQSSNSLACPAMDAPRALEAMKKMEFILVADPFLTPTAVAVADIVLPVGMGPERNSVRNWWTPMRAQSKVCQYYEAKGDEEIVVEFGKRLNPEAFPFDNDVDLLNWYLTMDGDYPGNWNDLREKTWEYWDWDAAYRKYEKGMLREDGEMGFNTPTGKLELAPLMYMQWELDPLPFHIEPPEGPVTTPELYEEYPLILTTGARSYEFFHSEHRQMPTMREFHPDPLVTMHPQVAAANGIKDGEWVWIESPRGRFKQKAYLTPGINSKVINAEHGWWFPEQGPENWFGVFDSNPNNLTRAEVTGQGGIGSPIKSMLCKIYKVEEGVNDLVSPTEQVVKLGGFKHGQ
ncbi:molybdopterin-dependent oxidoreductase [Desulfitobacterium hafniense]|uniref:molybdopterin-dependent oxidoreductase n=1 Tax=Desulfitobacterium hafniense TaxID=49338 RepID=UPI000368B379|nr:molybdopterin-dependent oxidoreductase [Desulfitobacterium hafniense]